MNDKLLEGIAAAARATEPAYDERYAARIEGTLSEKEAAELEALGATSEAHRQAWVASAPLGEAKRAEIADQIVRSLASRKSEARVVPLRPRRLVPALLVAAALAAAAGFAFFRVAGPAPLPAYAMLVQGGDQAVRSEPNVVGEQPIRLGPGARLALTLRPATRVEGEVAVEAYLVRGGKARRWDVRTEVSADGAAHLRGDRASLFKDEPLGEVEIVMVVGRPGAMPADFEAASRTGASARWAVLRRAVSLVDDKPGGE